MILTITVRERRSNGYRIHDGGIMRRWNFFIEQEWLDKIIQEMKRFGFRTPASFLRYIIIKHFEDIDNRQVKKTDSKKFFENY